MSDKRLLIQLTLYDADSGNVVEQSIEEYEGQLGYEVIRLFDRLGEKFAPKLDPYYGKD